MEIGEQLEELFERQHVAVVERTVVHAQLVLSVLLQKIGNAVLPQLAVLAENEHVSDAVRFDDFCCKKQVNAWLQYSTDREQESLLRSLARFCLIVLNRQPTNHRKMFQHIEPGK